LFPFLQAQPQKVPGMGELALGPLMFGASSTLLNADHYNVYFKGMPLWNGKVSAPLYLSTNLVLQPLE